jgi:hypothetical protein
MACYRDRFTFFLPFTGTASYELMQRKIMNMGNAMYGDNVEIVAILKLMKGLSVLFFFTEGHITRPPAVTLGQVVSENKIFTLFIGALDDSHVVLFPS